MVDQIFWAGTFMVLVAALMVSHAAAAREGGGGTCGVRELMA
jgi:hypothetical protein